MSPEQNGSIHGMSRALGSLEASVKGLSKDFYSHRERVEEVIEQLDKKLDALAADRLRAEGSFMTLRVLWLAGSGLFGGIAGAIATKFGWK